MDTTIDPGQQVLGLDGDIVRLAIFGLADDFTPIAVAGVGVAVGILVVRRGWGLLKSLAK